MSLQEILIFIEVLLTTEASEILYPDNLMVSEKKTKYLNSLLLTSRPR